MCGIYSYHIISQPISFLFATFVRSTAFIYNTVVRTRDRVPKPFNSED